MMSTPQTKDSRTLVLRKIVHNYRKTSQFPVKQDMDTNNHASEAHEMTPSWSAIAEKIAMKEAQKRLPLKSERGVLPTDQGVLEEKDLLAGLVVQIDKAFDVNVSQLADSGDTTNLTTEDEFYYETEKLLHLDTVLEEKTEQKWLLPPPLPHHQNRKCLVLDLDETLIHSTFMNGKQKSKNFDFVITVGSQSSERKYGISKRPGVDQFLKRMGELYEVVVFTASRAGYAGATLDKLDVDHSIHHRLFRDNCESFEFDGKRVKNLSKLGRDLSQTIIIDDSPQTYIFHPRNGISISCWKSDPTDNELLNLIPTLEDLARPEVTDIRAALDLNRKYLYGAYTGRLLYRRPCNLWKVIVHLIKYFIRRSRKRLNTLLVKKGEGRRLGE